MSINTGDVFSSNHSIFNHFSSAAVHFVEIVIVPTNSIMSSKTFFLVASFAAILGLASGRSTENNSAWYLAGTPGFVYDCSDKVDGNYPHPTLCTHYVACVGRTEAYEMVCALNHDGEPLHYVQNSGPNETLSRCDYPEVAGCQSRATTEAPATPEPTRPAPETTTRPAPDTTTEVPTTAAPPSPVCEDHDCHQDGNCTSYERCERGTWTKGVCDTNRFWNPEKNNGTCDFYKNLSEDVQDLYLNDETCIPPCEWWQLPEEKCTGKYHFREPFDGVNLVDREHELTCPTAPADSSEKDLVWDPKTKNCVNPDTINCP